MAKPKQTGPSALRGSKGAKQHLLVILEVLGGGLSTTEASEAMGVTASRYYQLETRALQGMLSSLEPRARGPQKTPEREIKALLLEQKRLEKELRKAQSLLRVATRSVGVRPKKKKAGKRRKRRASRGSTVLKTLRKEAGDEAGAAGSALDAGARDERGGAGAVGGDPVDAC